MDVDRALAFSTVFVIVTSAVVAGPLIPGVGLPATADDRPTPGTGTANVTVESVPETVTLRRGAFGAGTYHLEAPPAVVTVRDVDGNPTLNYGIDVPALDYTSLHSYELAGREGKLRLEFRPFEISPRRVNRDSYEATVSVWLVTRGNEYVSLYQETVTVEVRR